MSCPSTISLSGADASLFTISSGGVLTFTSGRDFENPSDADTDGVYLVTVTVSDGSLTDAQLIRVTVSAVADNIPNITSNGGGPAAEITLHENTRFVTTVTATDSDLPSETLLFSISGTDAGLFVIDELTGELEFVAPPDFENPADADGNNRYEITVFVHDGTHTDSQDLQIMVAPVNDHVPIITSNGGGDSALINVQLHILSTISCLELWWCPRRSTQPHFAQINV